MISVAVCTFNNVLTLKRTLDSILNQSYCAWEIIIIDANSTDGTKEIINTYALSDPRIRFQLLEYQSKWVNSTLRALEIAKGKYFMFLDADDFISKNYMMDLVSVLENRKVVGSAGVLKLVDSYGNEVVNNLSTNRYFKFTNHKYRVVRVTLALLTPESFGLVNFLYGLWLTSTLKSLKLWDKSEASLNFDQEFVLNVLNKGTILYVPNVNHFRTTLSKRSRNEIGKIRYFLNNYNSLKNFSGAFLYIIELFKTPPPFSLYLKWIFSNKSPFSILYLGVVVFRVILSFPKSLVKFVTLTFKKTYNTLKFIRFY